MNGYSMMANSYKKLMKEGVVDKETAEKKIRVYEFLATCDIDDFCNMVDSTAFNDFIRAFLKISVKNAGVAEKEQDKIFNQLHLIFDEMSAKEVINNSN